LRHLYRSAYQGTRLGFTIEEFVDEIEDFNNVLEAGMVKIMRSIAMFLLTINPTFIPHRFSIWDFRFWI